VSVVVVATITPLPEHRDEVRQVLLDTIPRVHDEPGCEFYALQEDDEGFVMLERWASAEALKTHSAAAALADAGRAMAGKLTGAPAVRTLSAIPAGDGTKGAL
jgi:quinol monooxygenase YgiN